MGLLGDIGNLATGFITTPTSMATNILGGVSGTSAANANSASQLSADNAEAFAQSSANQQMAFQERMSDTAYQRATADMKAAGINPMLAYMNGGASTPSGSSAQGQAVQMQDTGAAALGNIGKLAGAAQDVGTLGSTISQMQAQTRVANANAAQTEALTPTAVGKQASETALNNSTAMLQANQAKEIQSRIPTYKTSIDKMLKETDLLQKTGQGKDIQNKVDNRTNNFIETHPNLFKTDMTTRMLTGGLSAGKSAAELGAMIR